MPIDETQAIQDKVDAIITESAVRDLSDEIRARIDGLVEQADAQMEEVEQLLADIQEAPLAQTFDGVKYPRAAFAYAPDPEKPSTWKLPLWGPDMKLSRKRVSAAVAAFSSGGFRGQKVQIPAGVVAAVKAKIRAALRKFGVKDEDMKPHIKETQSRGLLNEVLTIELSEGLADALAIGTMPVRFLVPGLNTDKDRFYTEQAVQDACKVFEGVKMYANHPTRSEGKERPERDVRDWVANLRNCRVAPSGAAVGDAVIHESWFKAKAQGLLEAGELEGLGTSIIGVGSGAKNGYEVEKGRKAHIIENILKGRSCDFVTEPGAGGRAGLQESISATLYDEQNDIDLLNEADLRERRPDLVTLIETNRDNNRRTEMDDNEKLKEQIAELEGSRDTLVAERDTLQAKVEEAEQAEAKAKAQAEIKELVEAEKELPEPIQKRLVAQFADAASTEGVAEAIADQKALMAELTETGKVKDMGRGDPPDDAKKIEATLIENAKQRFIKQGFNEEDAERMAQTYMGQ